MESLFRVHKPRIRDLCFIKNRRLHHFVCSTIKILRRISDNPKSVIKILYKYILSNRWVLVFILCIGKLYTILKNVKEYNSIFLYNIISFVSSIAKNSLYPLPIDKHNPRVIGIIPDGNRRWSRSLPDQVLTPSEGHFFGAYKIANLIRWSIIDPNVSHLVIYLLTYDNYTKRSEEEQKSIREILNGWVGEFETLNSSGYADIAVIGEPDSVFRESLGGIPINPPTRDMSKTRVSLLLCYDGRREIVQSGGNPKKLWLKEDIDVVIRTGYTQRSSGFCPYQTVYSEWFFPGMYWPEFSVQTFKNILEESYKIQRNFGR